MPPDVAAQFAGEALRRAQAAAEPAVGADFDAHVRAGDVHQVFRFSDDYLAGTPTGEPVVPADSWVAPILHGDEVRGALWVGKPEGAPAEMQGYTDDVVLGTLLQEVRPGEVLVEDAPIGGWYALDGTMIRPLDDWAANELPQPTDIAEYQPVLAERIALTAEQAADPDGGVADGRVLATLSVLGIVAVVLLAGAGLARRRHRDHVARTTG